jgi:cation diffusion facilitator family transporter
LSSPPAHAAETRDAAARRRAMGISLAVSVLMLVGKLTAYFITHSAAIFSDAAESLVHGAATGLAAFSLWYAARPADANHPYGHGRIAYFSIGFEGALVLAASITVLVTGIRDLIIGPRLHNVGTGLAIATMLAAINVAVATQLIRTGKRTRSEILVANGTHVMSDVWTTLAAVIGVGLATLSGWTWLDPVTAIVMAPIIMASGLTLMRRSLAGLLDEVDPQLTARLNEAFREQVARGEIADFHQLRFRRLSGELWLDVHLLIPGEYSLVEAHARATRVEDGVRRRLPEFHVVITTHLEPADHHAAHPDGHPTESVGRLG